MRFMSLLFILCFSLRMNFSPFQSNIAIPEAHVGRFMLLAVKEKGVSVESEYFWHLSYLFSAKIGIVYDTHNDKVSKLR